MHRFILLAVLLASPACADPVWPVRPEPGLVCMTLTAPAQIVEQPRSNATSLATAGAIVFAVQPLQISNGYVKVERPNRQIGWVPQTALASGPVKCEPMLMSNGLVLLGSTS